MQDVCKGNGNLSQVIRETNDDDSFRGYESLGSQPYRSIADELKGEYISASYLSIYLLPIPTPPSIPSELVNNNEVSHH